MSETRLIERFGGSNIEHHMGLKPSRKAFRAISTILYKDRIKAIIRELSCNAYDAHMEAGYPERQFEVHLPNKFDAFFSVRDFGAGISPDDMENVYCTFFESTKEENPDLIGTLGLGSKSPLCYTNSFTVTSYYEGMFYHYAIFFDEKDFPTFKVLASGPSDDLSGLEVKVPLANTHDCSTFVDKAKEVFIHFHTKPIFFGETLEIPEKELLLEGENWRFVLNETRYSCQAVMAQVAYPIDINSIPNLTYKDRIILEKRNIEIEFPNNSLTFMPGRDDLSYDKKTCKVIFEALNEISDDIPKAINRKLDSCENDFDARLCSGKITRHVGSSHIQHKYKGDVLEQFYNFNTLDLADVILYKVWTRYGKRRKIEKDHLLHVSEKTVYCIEGEPLISQAKIHQYMKDNWRNVDILYIVRANEEKLKKVYEKLPHVPFKTASEIKLDAKIRRTYYGSKTTIPAMTLNSYELSYSGHFSKWRKSLWHNETTIPTSGIYVARTGCTVTSRWAKGANSDINFLKTCYDLDILTKDDEIYGFNKSKISKLSNDWIEVRDYVRKKCKEKIAAYGGDISNQTQTSLNNLKSYYNEFYYDEYMDYCGIILNLINRSHPMWMFFNKLFSSRKYNEFNQFCIRLGVLEPAENEEDLSDIWTKLIVKYPLFPRNSKKSLDAEHIRRYIEMCDGE